MDLHHGVGKKRGRAGVADAPTGHGAGLRETVQEDAAFAHPGERRDADVLGAVVGQFTVDFVREHDEIVIEVADRMETIVALTVLAAVVGVAGM